MSVKSKNVSIITISQQLPGLQIETKTIPYDQYTMYKPSFGTLETLITHAGTYVDSS